MAAAAARALSSRRQSTWIKNGIPTEAMVASVIVDEHAWHKPFYRKAEHMAFQGLPIDRSTLADWVGTAAAELTPIYERMKHVYKSRKENVRGNRSSPLTNILPRQSGIGIPLFIEKGI